MNKNIQNLPVIILLGGRGSRFSLIHESPKQLSKLNKNTILIEIMNLFIKHGFNHFIFPLGYKKKFFLNFFRSRKNILKYNFNILKDQSKLTDIKKNKINISLFDAGKKTNKLRRIYKSFKCSEKNDFLVTYGDGLANINIKKLLKKYYLSNNQKAFVTSYEKNSGYGHIISDKKNFVKKFIEKPKYHLPINIGFYIFPKSLILKHYKYNFDLEDNFLPRLIKLKLLKTYLHKGYFFSVDDKKDLIKAKKQLTKNS